MFFCIPFSARPCIFGITLFAIMVHRFIFLVNGHRAVDIDSCALIFYDLRKKKYYHGVFLCIFPSPSPLSVIPFEVCFSKDIASSCVSSFFPSQDSVHQMSRPQDPHRNFLPFGNPFRNILPKGASLSPKMLDLLNNFEENLAEKLRKLKPAGREDVLSFTWMTSAMELLCEIHADIKVLITALELPVCDWDDKWIDVYLDNSVKLLDICIAFTSEISRLKQGHLFLRCLLHDLDNSSSSKFFQARSSLDGWRQHMGSKNPRFANIFSIMDSLAQTLDLPKIKNSSKGKVLMRAMYGVKVVTIFICSVFATAFSGSAEKLMEIQVPETCLWAQSFSDLQTYVNSEIRNMHLEKKDLIFSKEVEAVESGMRKVSPIVEDGVENLVEAEVLQKSKSDLEKSGSELSRGLDLLGKEVDGFFQVVLTGRDALLSNLRLVGSVFEQVERNLNVQSPAVR